MPFNIHTIYVQLFKIWRSKRMLLFEEMIDPQQQDVLLDVGGHPSTWVNRPQITKRIDCLNLHRIQWPTETESEYLPNPTDAANEYRITTIPGDGCALNYSDESYDILFSNSVIEHVGGWEQQRAFASEARRVGKKIWVQTPAFECPLEPHFLAPFVHWLPVAIRRLVTRWFTPWGWFNRPSQAITDRTIEHTRLLTKRQMQELFPDCKILTESLIWFIPKSYIAYRASKEANYKSNTTCK